MKTACLISTGTELLLGTTNDSNSTYIAERLFNRGIRVVGKVVVGDNHNTIKKAFENALDLADIVVSSGGLGPTRDDLTKEVACEVMGCDMLINMVEVQRLKDYFARRQRSMPESNLKQALFPPEAEIIYNSLGTAPGMYLKKDNKVLVLLPGPPREMEPMFKQEIEPRLERDFPQAVNRVIRRTIKILGPGESQLEKMLDSVMDAYPELAMALLAVDGEIHIKLTVEGQDINHSQELMEKVSQSIKESVGRHIVGYDDDSLVSVVARCLVETEKKLAVAESCTGGLLAKMITDLPGSSEYFWGSVTSYSNEAKMLYLDVKRETLEKHGAVSPEVAREMAQGMQKKSGAELALSITGIAGPNSDAKEKPVGLVYICLAAGDLLQVKEMHFVGNRESIRILAAKTALDLLRRHLINGGR
ncbi:MAG: competence/damage-inducible protein A [Syntrophomonas sp.]|uniref:competence/damage-inducible protein A n=1 Tax=Syntrophomonas sp. TaxID=2053627 RepID=UPI0026263A4C|nr:competence/damage-inducible protein A [Syntrophomonas sp.]MDD2509702.1 competence/damage-inducible protein A [Syntrophomonas sp.]MDD4625834.1 competence/damage-inducible protein A [Syntrophomonas sp.]